MLRSAFKCQINFGHISRRTFRTINKNRHVPPQPNTPNTSQSQPLVFQTAHKTANPHMQLSSTFVKTTPLSFWAKFNKSSPGSKPTHSQNHSKVKPVNYDIIQQGTMSQNIVNPWDALNKVKQYKLLHLFPAAILGYCILLSVSHLLGIEPRLTPVVSYYDHLLLLGKVDKNEKNDQNHLERRYQASFGKIGFFDDWWISSKGCEYEIVSSLLDFNLTSTRPLLEIDGKIILTHFEYYNRLFGSDLLTTQPTLSLSLGNKHSDHVRDWIEVRKYIIHQGMILANQIDFLEQKFLSLELPGWCYIDVMDPYSDGKGNWHASYHFRDENGNDLHYDKLQQLHNTQQDPSPLTNIHPNFPTQLHSTNNPGNPTIDLNSSIRRQLSTELSPILVYNPHLGFIPLDPRLPPEQQSFHGGTDLSRLIHYPLYSNIATLKQALGGIVEFAVEGTFAGDKVLGDIHHDVTYMAERFPEFLGIIDGLKLAVDNLYYTIHNGQLYHNSSNSAAWWANQIELGNYIKSKTDIDHEQTETAEVKLATYWDQINSYISPLSSYIGSPVNNSPEVEHGTHSAPQPKLISSCRASHLTNDQIQNHFKLAIHNIKSRLRSGIGEFNNNAPHETSDAEKNQPSTHAIPYSKTRISYFNQIDPISGIYDNSSMKKSQDNKNNHFLNTILQQFYKTPNSDQINSSPLSPDQVHDIDGYSTQFNSYTAQIQNLRRVLSQPDHQLMFLWPFHPNMCFPIDRQQIEQFYKNNLIPTLIQQYKELFVTYRKANNIIDPVYINSIRDIEIQRSSIEALSMNLESMDFRTLFYYLNTTSRLQSNPSTDQKDVNPKKPTYSPDILNNIFKPERLSSDSYDSFTSHRGIAMKSLSTLFNYCRGFFSRPNSSYSSRNNDYACRDGFNPKSKLYGNYGDALTVCSGTTFDTDNHGVNSEHSNHNDNCSVKSMKYKFGILLNRHIGRQCDQSDDKLEKGGDKIGVIKQISDIQSSSPIPAPHLPAPHLSTPFAPSTQPNPTLRLKYPQMWSLQKMNTLLNPPRDLVIDTKKLFDLFGELSALNPDIFQTRKFICAESQDESTFSHFQNFQNLQDQPDSQSGETHLGATTTTPQPLALIDQWVRIYPGNMNQDFDFTLPNNSHFRTKLLPNREQTLVSPNINSRGALLENRNIFSPFFVKNLLSLHHLPTLKIVDTDEEFVIE